MLRFGDKWVLLRNNRFEWELPGGRVDPGDRSLEEALQRECREELGVDVEVGPLVDSYLFEVVPGRRVTIICFAATVAATAEGLTLSDEHKGVGLFSTNQLDDLTLPDGYRAAIEKAQGV